MEKPRPLSDQLTDEDMAFRVEDNNPNSVPNRLEDKDVFHHLSAAEAYPDALRDMDGWIVDSESVQTFIAENGEPHVRGSE